eukprot:gene8475-11457_t
MTLAQFPKEKDPSHYVYDIDTRYNELKPLLDSATLIAEKYMNSTGFFNLMGGIWSLPEEVKYYYRLANLPDVHTICDIGFNAGHSALTFLSANPTAHVISIDICKMSWTMNSAEYVKTLFPERFHFIKGHSGRIMQRAAHNKTIMFNRRCDLISVDGDHSAAWDDIWAGYHVSRKFAYIVIDDFATLMGRVVNHWEMALRKNVVKELDRHKDVSVGRGWVLGIYNNDELE